MTGSSTASGRIPGSKGVPRICQGLGVATLGFLRKKTENQYASGFKGVLRLEEFKVLFIFFVLMGFVS